jgi:hypothetical protein
MKKTKIKNIFKLLKNPRLISAFVISFVLSFMLYFYEPLTMYLNNSNDFWFNLELIMGPIIVITLILFFILSMLFLCLYFLCIKFTKTTLIFDVCLFAFFVGFVCTYIQGNFLANNLPPLDGTTIVWNDEKYLFQNIVSIVLWLIIILATIVVIIKVKKDKMVKYTKYIAICIFVMLMVSLATVIITNKDINKNDYSIVVTKKNIDNASTNKNFFVLLVDATDSVTFEEEMNKDASFKNMFNDFTYYKDTMSVYPYTRDSIPLILSGLFNENKTDFATYSTNAFNNSKFLKKLDDEGYNMNIYETGLIWNDKNAYKINNISNYKKSKTIEKMNFIIYFKEQTKYVLFKYLPFSLKKISRIEKMDFLRANKDLYRANNIKNYERIKNNKVNKTDENYFQFLHIDGSHVPFELDKNVTKIENGTYNQQVQATLTIIKEYIKKLKNNNIFDNSVVVIMADHGYAGDDVIGRQNPILFIKGINEHHEMINSDFPVSQADLVDAFVDLADGKMSTDLFENVNSDRERRFLFYEYSKENHMVEYLQKGKAWDEYTLIQTGVEFNR